MFRMKTTIQPGICIASRCHNSGAVILGAATNFLDIDKDVDVCDTHWTMVCDQQEKSTAPTLEIPVMDTPKRSKRNPVKKRLVAEA